MTARTLRAVADDVAEAGARRWGAPFGYIRSAVLSVDGGPPIDVTHLQGQEEMARAAIARYLRPCPWFEWLEERS